MNTRDRLLDEAASLFRQKGYVTTTTRELADRLGIRKASLYHHIDTKEDLLQELCTESLRRITVAVGAVARSEPRETRLRRVIVTHLVTAVADRDMHATMLIEMQGLSDAAMVGVIRRRDAYEALLLDVIAEEQAEGRVRGDVDARLLTLTLLNVLNWTIFWFTPRRGMDADRLGAIFASIFLDGARVPAGAGVPALPALPTLPPTRSTIA